MADISAQYCKSSELTLFLVRGEVAAEDLMAAIETHYGANPTSIAVWDLTRSDLSDLDMQALVRVSDCARRFSQQRSNPRTLFVVRLEQETFLIKLYQEISAMRGSPTSYEHCSTLAEAYRKLGIDDPFAEQRDTA